jgi:hypothetical protein
MSNRTTAIALGTLIGCAAIAGLASLSATPASAADECLSAPKGATPAGAHWYYRLEKGTKRKCWYLADEVARAGNKTAAASAGDAATPAAAPTKPKAKTARASTVEDAHAELTAPDDDQPTLAETTWPPLPEQRQQAASPSAGDPPSAASAAPDTQGDATIAARWPTGAAADTRVAQAAAPAPAPRMQFAAATPTPAAAATDHAASAAHPAHDDVLSPFRILLIAVTIALALLAVLVSVLFKYVWRRRTAAAPADRRSIWDIAAPAADAPRDHRVRSQPAHPFGAQASREPRHPLAPEQDHRVDEIEALLRSTRDQTA